MIKEFIQFRRYLKRWGDHEFWTKYNKLSLLEKIKYNISGIKYRKSINKSKKQFRDLGRV